MGLLQCVGLLPVKVHCNWYWVIIKRTNALALKSPWLYCSTLGGSLGGPMGRFLFIVTPILLLRHGGLCWVSLEVELWTILNGA